ALPRDEGAHALPPLLARTALVRRRAVSVVAAAGRVGVRDGEARRAAHRAARLLAAPAARRALVRAAEERERGAREDVQVEQRAAMVDVPHVELDPPLPRERRAAVHLRPAGDARLHLEPPPLLGVVALDLVAQRR